ncbi:unnamed protein product [Chironomus riparius]|uniref:Uncharacterized protein n=1 Tax=Chironomus riparius TaxID=315576 RepID=A0A9N9RT77_9DIPT|nr:unnamed protein product [Chironomus riparius]
MRVILVLLIFKTFIVESYDIKDFIPVENMKQKYSSILNLLSVLTNPNITRHNFHEMIGKDQQKFLLDQFATRNDLTRILKVIFKLITFKKITKFFIIIGFLFFLPVMNSHERNSETILTERDDLDLYSFINKTDYRSIERYNFFIHSTEAFTSPLMVWCVAEHDAYCRFQGMFDVIDQLYPYDKLIERFLPNSTQFNLQFMIDKISPTIRNTLLRKSFYENDDDDDDDEGSGDRNDSDDEEEE